MEDLKMQILILRQELQERDEQHLKAIASLDAEVAKAKSAVISKDLKIKQLQGFHSEAQHDSAVKQLKRKLDQAELLLLKLANMHQGQLHTSGQSPQVATESSSIPNLISEFLQYLNQDTTPIQKAHTFTDQAEDHGFMRSSTIHNFEQSRREDGTQNRETVTEHIREEKLNFYTQTFQEIERQNKKLQERLDREEKRSNQISEQLARVR